MTTITLELMQKDMENMRDRLASIEEFIQSANKKIGTNTEDVRTLSTEFQKLKSMFTAFEFRLKTHTA